jgi:molecular chaperone IbpA
MRVVRNALSGFRGLLLIGPAQPGGSTVNLAPAGGFIMTTYDFAPLFRTAIGFDRLARLMDSAASGAEAPSYPPYNIEKTGDDTYRLTMAVAGFRPEDLDLTVKENTLLISGRVNGEANKGEVLYRGIAGRAFERRFVLADHIVVEGADLVNGLLHVGLKRVVPEALKPRKIAIGGTTVPTAIANDATGEAAKAA